MRNLSLLTLLLAAGPVSCGGYLYTVDNSEGGIPFYEVKHFDVRVSACQQDLHALRVRLFEEVPGAGDAVRGDMTFYTTSRECADRVIGDFDSEEVGSAAWENLKTLPKKLTKEHPCKAPGISRVPPAYRTAAEVSECKGDGYRWMSSALEQRTVVGERHVLNVKASAAGTTSATVKLNDKGLLTESEASRENKTLEIAVDAAMSLAELASGQLPFKELLSKRWKVGEKEDKKAAGMGVRVASTGRATIGYAFVPRLYTFECELEAKGAEAKDAEAKGTEAKGAEAKGAEAKGAEAKDAEAKGAGYGCSSPRAFKVVDTAEALQKAASKPEPEPKEPPKKQ